MRFLLTIFLILTITYANDLKNSKSPYLLQHKDNPVNWMEWGNKAFKKAKRENKLIFLSIGYSTCHWCHVMARESFSQKDVAKVLNKNYISIKVDRERRSDIDSYYQLGYRIVNGRGGGWPLSVILLPNRKPIYFATYMPKDILIETLNNVATMDRVELNRVGTNIENAIKKRQNSKLPSAKIPHNLAKRALVGFKSIYDKKYKGFSHAPKFPQPSSIDALLNIYELTGNKEALNMATAILEAMAKGGIYDQIEGGFFRYSVDAKWEIPHFEKMLYTNAELISLYSKAYKITKKPLFAKVVKETISNIENRFNKNGLYYSASNADSKNEDGIEQEGYYFVYEYQKALDYLLKSGIDKKRAKAALKYFGIEQMGNFEGGDYSNPTLNGKINNFSKERKLLLNLRETKEYPFIDKKINTSWNALYIKALFDAGYIDKKFTKMAINRANNLLKLFYKNDKLYHQTLLPNKPTQNGLLEDYSFVANMLITAYETTLDSRYLTLFNKVVKKSVKLFYTNGSWYANSKGKMRVKSSLEDSGYKSPSALMVENILLDIAIAGEYKLLNVVKNTLKSNAIYLKETPHYYATFLNSALMFKEGLYVVKGKKSGLLNLKFKIRYPYIYKEAQDYKDYQICGLQSCFATLKSLKDIDKSLRKIIYDKMK